VPGADTADSDRRSCGLVAPIAVASAPAWPHIKGKAVLKRLRKISGLALMVALIVLLSTTAAVLWAGLSEDLAPVDVAIVPGSKVEIDGTPSARLAARLDRALELYRAGVFGTVIVSGGVGKERHNEAQVMRDYLIAKGVPAAAIMVDADGVTSAATARNSAAFMRAHGFKSALVVTQYFHVPRMKMALRASGIEPVHGAYARFFEGRDIYSTLRELAAIPLYWVTGAAD
jgi:uncharacterized SAM-binding protein YcdF (DUF218 family)